MRLDLTVPSVRPTKIDLIDLTDPIDLISYCSRSWNEFLLFFLSIYVYVRGGASFKNLGGGAVVMRWA